MNVCLADLHVHTALSPCADGEMTPPAIVERALAEGLAMIAVCDHNSARNTAAVQAAAGARLAVLAGMEVTTAEECHVVGLFPDAGAAAAAGLEVGATLPCTDDGYEAFFGEQLVLDAGGAEVAREDRALATATTLDVDAVVALIHRHGGLAVAAHIDRRSFGVIGQLGFFPDAAGFDAVEVSRHVADDAAAEVPTSASTACRWCTRPTPTTWPRSAWRAPRCAASAPASTSSRWRWPAARAGASAHA